VFRLYLLVSPRPPLTMSQNNNTSSNTLRPPSRPSYRSRWLSAPTLDQAPLVQLLETKIDDLEGEKQAINAKFKNADYLKLEEIKRNCKLEVENYNLRKEEERLREENKGLKKEIEKLDNQNKVMKKKEVIKVLWDDDTHYYCTPPYE
jgi:hypothetical protein